MGADDITMLKGIIFDLGGVVVDWSNDITYNFIENRYGIDFECARSELERKLPLVQTGDLSERDWLREFFLFHGISPTVDHYHVWGDTFIDAGHDEDVVRIVRSLKRQGYRLGALSNIEPSRASEMRQREIMDYFDVVVFSCEVGLRKRSSIKSGEIDTEIYVLALERMGLQPGECLYIDDIKECTDAAEEAGIRNILFTDARQLINELLSFGIDLSISES